MKVGHADLYNDCKKKKRRMRRKKKKKKKRKYKCVLDLCLLECNAQFLIHSAQ